MCSLVAYPIAFWAGQKRFGGPCGTIALGFLRDSTARASSKLQGYGHHADVTVSVKKNSIKKTNKLCMKVHLMLSMLLLLLTVCLVQQKRPLQALILLKT